MDRVIPLVLDVALKGTLLLAIAWLATFALRRRSAALRHGIWTSAVLAHLLLPAGALILPAWHLPLPAASAWLARALPTTPAQSGSGAPTPNGDTGTRSGPTDSLAVASAKPSAMWPESSMVGDTTQQQASSSVTPAASLDVVRQHPVLAIWLAGCVIVLASLMTGTIGVWRLARRSTRVQDGGWLGLTQRLADRLDISRPLTLRQGADLGVPVTFGVVYPVVLLPPDADAWDAEQRREVLVHEMAHVRRLDALTQLIAQIVSAVFWFSPLVWVGLSHMRREREHACDDVVLHEGTRASRYADDLLTMVRALGTPSHRRTRPAFAALAMARRSEFEGRMLAILEPNHDRRPLHTRGTTMLALTVAALTMTLAAAQLQTPSPATTVAASNAAGAASPRTGSPTHSTISAADAPARSTTGLVISSDTARTSDTVAQAIASDRCDLARGETGNTSTHTHIDSDNDASRRIDLQITQNGRCLEAVIHGAVRFSEDEQRVTRVPFDGLVMLRERRPDMDRRVRYVGSAEGTIEGEFTSNGTRRDIQSAAEWIAAVLPEVLRESGVDVEARVSRVRRTSGIDGVLEMIDETRSASSKRAHYIALLTMSGISETDMELVMRRATRSLASSPGDLRVVLETVPTRARRTPRVRAAMESAIGSMTSDGDRRTLLIQYAARGERDMLVVSLRGVRMIDSDGDKRDVLLTATAATLRSHDPELQDAYFDAWKTMQSDGDRAAVLMSAAPYGHTGSDLTYAILRAVRAIRSDGDATRVLITVAGQRLITTPALRAAYLEAARGLSSSGDQARAISALIATTSDTSPPR